MSPQDELEQIYKRINARVGETSPPQLAPTEVESERFRTGAQGFTFGFADEIEAAVRSVLPERFGGGEYEQIRDDLRRRLADYKEANPTEALTAETAGALATMFIPGLNVARGAQLAVQGGKAVAPSLARVGAIGAAEGGAYAAGTSEADPFSKEMARDIAEGAVTGAILPTAATAGFRGIKGAASGLFNTAREKFGTKVDNVVQQYITDLAEQAGKTPDEIVADLVSGRRLTDNETVTIALKAFVNQGGKAADRLVQSMRDRAGELQDASVDALRGALARGSDDNVLMAVEQTAEKVKKGLGGLYDNIYEQHPVVTEPIARSVEAILQRVGPVRSKMAELYNTKNLVPLFKVGDDGAVTLARAPSLEDADLVQIQMRELITQAYKAGDTKLAEEYKSLRQALRKQLDSQYDDLAQSRAAYARNLQSGEQFDAGYKSLTKDADLVQKEFLKLSPEMQESFRMGVFAALKNRITRQPKSIEDAASDRNRLNEILRIVTPADQIDDLLGQLATAGQARQAAQKIPRTAGSPTEPLRQEAQRRAQRLTTAQEVAESAGFMGFTGASLRVGLRKLVETVTQAKPLSEAQRELIVDALTTNNPQELQRILNSGEGIDQLVAQINNLAVRVGPATRQAITQQASQADGPRGLL